MFHFKNLLSSRNVPYLRKNFIFKVDRAALVNVCVLNASESNE